MTGPTCGASMRHSTLTPVFADLRCEREPDHDGPHAAGPVVWTRAPRLGAGFTLRAIGSGDNPP